MFTQPFIEAQIKENTKAPRHWPPHKWPVTRKMFPFDNVIMLLALCDRTLRSPVNSYYKEPVMRSIDVFFDAGFNKLLNKQSFCRFWEVSWRPCDVTLISHGNHITSLPMNSDTTKCNKYIIRITRSFQYKQNKQSNKQKHTKPNAHITVCSLWRLTTCGKWWSLTCICTGYLR